MPFPQNAALIDSIVRKAMYDQVAAAANARFYPRISEEVAQPTTTATYTTFGSVPEPNQLTGSIVGGGSRRATAINDYTHTNTILEWEQNVPMYGSTLEDNPGEAERIGRQIGQKATVFLDKQAAVALTSTTALGYDGIALYSASHAESGSNQSNTDSDSIVLLSDPTVGELETALSNQIAVMRGFTDDQGTPVNEGETRWHALIPPIYEQVFDNATNPNLSPQAVDSSGGTGVFKNKVTYTVSAYATDDGLPTGTADRYFLFAENAFMKALRYYTKTPLDVSSNFGNNNSDVWRSQRLAIFASYARWNFGVGDWKSTTRQVFTTT